MTHQYIASGDGSLPFSAAVVAGDHCYISGQVAIDPDTGQLRSGSTVEEFQLAMSNVLAVARTAGFNPDEIVFVTVLLADIADYAAVNAVYRDVFPPEKLPARMMFQVAALPLGARIEIQAVAAHSEA